MSPAQRDEWDGGWISFEWNAVCDAFYRWNEQQGDDFADVFESVAIECIPEDATPEQRAKLTYFITRLSKNLSGE